MQYPYKTNKTNRTNKTKEFTSDTLNLVIPDTRNLFIVK